MAQMNRVLLWLINRRNVRRSARLMGPVAPHLRLGPTSRTLELGAGLGGLSALVFERFRPREVVVTDLDERQVETCREYLVRRFGVMPPAFRVQPADALALAFPDSSFECVFAIGVLHHVEEHHGEYARRPTALAEIRRVLVPGGTFVYTEFTGTDEVRTTLADLGFTRVVPTQRAGHQELEIYRTPAGPSSA
jgi:ubiquinone/menaquinone biosynthesis C-methylase UbiE